MTQRILEAKVFEDLSSGDCRVIAREQFIIIENGKFSGLQKVGPSFGLNPTPKREFSEERAFGKLMRTLPSRFTGETVRVFNGHSAVHKAWISSPPESRQEFYAFKKHEIDSSFLVLEPETEAARQRFSGESLLLSSNGSELATVVYDGETMSLCKILGDADKANNVVDTFNASQNHHSPSL